jgi:hypothetical protein
VTAPAANTASAATTSARGLVPKLLGDEKHVQIRAKRATHIGEQKIERVERNRVETAARCRVTPPCAPLPRDWFSIMLPNRQ